MKIIILAGGWGSRLGSHTESIPKPMVKIGEKPILWHIMKIYSHYNYNDFIICLGVKGEIIKNYFRHFHILNNDISINLSDSYINYLNNLNEIDWNVSLINTGLNTPKGGRIKKVEKYLDDINIVTYGDSLADIDIDKLVNFHRSHGKMVTITAVHPPARFGEIVEYNNKVLTFKEKPNKSIGLINGGFIVFNKILLNYLDDKSDFESDVLESLSNEGEVMIYKHSGQWECMDHERDYIHLNELWDSNKAFWKVWDE